MTGNSALLALVAGGLVGVGLLAAVLAFTGVPARDPSKPPLLRSVVGGRPLVQRALYGAIAAIVVLALTRWPVVAVSAFLLVTYWDRIVGSAKAEQVGIARLEALATWTESLRDTIAGAIGLEQAIPASVAATPPVIRPALNLLVDRLRIREPLPDALLAFAEDLDDPSADTVVAALVLNSRLRGPGLHDVLSALAVSTREELDMRRRVEAGRRSIRRSVRIVLAIVLGVGGLLAVLNRSYVEPYSSFAGQMVLLLVAGLLLAGLLWLRRLARAVTAERFLVVRGTDREAALDEAGA
jgi:Flp pilus assembly protein TadB